MEKARQYSVVRYQTIIALLIVALPVLVFGYFNYEKREAPLPWVTAMGGSWFIKDLIWTETAGAWRVSGVFAPRYVQLNNPKVEQLLSSFCVALLTERPGYMRAKISRKDIYRVDLNFEKGATNEQPQGLIAYPVAVPVPVEDGVCKVGLADTLYYPTYPAPLDDWHVSYLEAQTSKGKTHLSVEFEARPGKAPKLQDFPMKFACEAVRDDPLASWATIREVSVMPDADLILDKIEITARKRKTIGFEFLNVGGSINKNATFMLSQDGCVPLDEGSHG